MNGEGAACVPVGMIARMSVVPGALRGARHLLFGRCKLVASMRAVRCGAVLRDAVLLCCTAQGVSSMVKERMLAWEKNPIDTAVRPLLLFPEVRAHKGDGQGARRVRVGGPDGPQKGMWPSACCGLQLCHVRWLLGKGPRVAGISNMYGNLLPPATAPWPVSEDRTR